LEILHIIHMKTGYILEESHNRSQCEHSEMVWDRRGSLRLEERRPLLTGRSRGTSLCLPTRTAPQRCSNSQFSSTHSLWRTDSLTIFAESEDGEDVTSTSYGPVVVASRQLRDNNHMPVGWFLAIISGLLFTTNNFFVKLLEMDAAEVLLVRSALKTVVLGLLLSAPGAPSLLPSSWSDCIFTWLQGICSGVRLLLQLACLHYLPLGDALTLIFTEPLWTVAASKLVLGTRIGPWKFCFALVLLTGMFLCIQPPFLFGARPEEGGQNDVVNGTNSISNSTSNNQGSGSNNHDIDPDKKEHTQFENLYFVGAGLALGSAVTGAASNVLIAKCHQVSSSVMVFYSGVGGVFLSILSGFSDPSNRILFHITTITTSQWVVLGVLGVAGVLGYFCLTRSLQLIPPTTVAVLRAMEIIISYLIQARRTFSTLS